MPTERDARRGPAGGFHPSLSCRNDYPGCGAAVEVGEPFEMSVNDRRNRAGARIRCRRPQRPHPAGTPSVAILRGVLDRLWTAATRHPFLAAVREGTITD